ncbi:YciI family protein [Pseudonocardia humida]|uniref:YCII-related domain-containing protein n=1 Tax=Pseudonocardia humida TaxID=2800819 RepID=A0ABT1A8P2_9PSEU|nr:YciI family protein [Pseudonocardia humida]MCO1659336.1 hypothetical protein [Pseudonocardia humida]
MTSYLLSVYQADGAPPADIDMDRIMRELGALQDRMKAEGAWVFTAGLHPASTATVVRAKGDEVLTTDGPFTEGKEHLGGFTVVESPDLDAALAWASEMTRITTLPVEVRPLAGDAVR